MTKTIQDTRKTQLKAVLVGIQLPKTSDLDTQSSLAELQRLVDTLGYKVIGSMSQKRTSTAGAIVVGEGKLLELAKWTGGSGQVQTAVKVKKSKAAERFGLDVSDGDREDEESSQNETADATSDVSNISAISTIDETTEYEDLDSAATDEPKDRADVVVFDCELSPSQLRNLESATGATVLDRTGVIIEIFSRHARTRAARLQVEIARLNYLAPRLRETGGSGDREGGGIGGKGAGETSQELDRRRIRDRIKELREELQHVQKESAVRRTRRSDENCVALIGYTNAGKSSLMRAITGSEILVADQLFATLETTVRPLSPPSVPKVLISDTVGFIKKLPHDLVASFKSTLDEALNADLLLFVVDAADPAFRSQLEVTQTVIAEIGAEASPRKLVLNKRDRLSVEEQAELTREFPEAIMISTRDPADLARLREEILNFFEGGMIDEELFVPYTQQGAVGEIRRSMRVISEAFDGAGVRFQVRASEEVLARFKRNHPVET